MRGICLALLVMISCLVGAQERIRDVIYYKQSGSAFTLDVFKPKISNHKAVIWIDSFGWYCGGEVDDDMAKQFNDTGFTFVVVMHGSRPNFTLSDIIPMVMRAVRFVRANGDSYGIDPNAIGVFGASSGGHLALEIAGLGDNGYAASKDRVETVSDRADAVAAIFAPTDFENWGTQGVCAMSAAGIKPWLSAWGLTTYSPKAMVRELAHDTSPIRLVRPGYPPTLLIHGDEDNIVPVQQSRSFDVALGRAGVDHKLVIYHGLGYEDATIERGIPEVIKWFDQHLHLTVK